MTLGNILKNTIDQKLRTEEKKKLEKQLREETKEKQERDELQRYLQHIKDQMIASIKDGKIPSYSVNAYHKQSWVISAVTPNTTAKNQDLWDEFHQFWKSEDLDVIVKNDHDGIGMKSWITISLNPLITNDQ